MIFNVMITPDFVWCPSKLFTLSASINSKIRLHTDLKLTTSKFMPSFCFSYDINMDSTFLGDVLFYGRQAAVSICFTTIVVIFVMLMRRRYFSGISQFKGPLLASVSAVWQIWHVAKGDIEYAVLREHEKHGSYRLNLTLTIWKSWLTYP